MPERTQTLSFLAGLALILFGLAAYLSVSRANGAFNHGVRQGIHAWASPALTWIMLRVTALGTEPYLLPLAVLVVWWLASTGRRNEAVMFAIAVAGAELLFQTLKLIFRVPRPEPFFGLATPLTYSFPSGHTLSCAVYFTRLAAALPPKLLIRLAAAALILAIGLSRIYLGFHYPSDVLGGYAAAVVWLAALEIVQRPRVRH